MPGSVHLAGSAGGVSQNGSNRDGPSQAWPHVSQAWQVTYACSGLLRHVTSGVTSHWSAVASADCGTYVRTYARRRRCPKVINQVAYARTYVFTYVYVRTSAFSSCVRRKDAGGDRPGVVRTYVRSQWRARTYERTYVVRSVAVAAAFCHVRTCARNSGGSVGMGTPSWSALSDLRTYVRAKSAAAFPSSCKRRPTRRSTSRLQKYSKGPVPEASSYVGGALQVLGGREVLEAPKRPPGGPHMYVRTYPRVFSISQHRDDQPSSPPSYAPPPPPSFII